MRTTCATYVDKETVALLIVRHKLSQLGMSEHIFGGTCPFCGTARSFCLWSDKGAFRCFHCGCDGRFVRTPERAAEIKKVENKVKESLKEMVY